MGVGFQTQHGRYARGSESGDRPGVVEAGAVVSAFDPIAMDEARRIFGERADLTLVSGPLDALKGADALLVVTEWKVFQSPDFATMKELLTSPVVFDGRNLYDPAVMYDAGFEYYPIGRK